MKSKGFIAINLISFIVAFAIAFLVSRDSDNRPATPMAEPEQARPAPIASFPVEDFSRPEWLKRLTGSGNHSLAELYALCEEQEAQAYQDMLVRYWSRTDPAGFLAFLNETPPFFKNESHADYLFSQWGARDFAQALVAAHDLSPYNPLRSRVLRTVVKARLPRQPEQAIAALSEIYANAGSSGTLFRDEPNPEQYLPALTKLPRGSLVNSAIDQAVTSWSELDADAALDWIKNDIDALDSNYRLSSVLYDLADRDHKAALDEFRKVPSARQRGELARNMAKYIARAAPEEAVSWLENEVGGWFRLDAVAEAANELAEGDPTSGADFAVQFQNPQLLERAVHEALSIFHSRDPEGLQRWALTMPNGVAKEVVNAEIKSLIQNGGGNSLR